MIDLSSEQKRILLESGVQKTWQITVYDDSGPAFTIPTSKMVDDSISIEEPLCTAETLDVGACESAIFSIKLADLDATTFKGRKIVVTLNALQDNVSVALNMGEFWVDDVTHPNNTWYYQLTAYDNMVKFDVKASQWYRSLQLPMTLRNFRTSLCAFVGVAVAPDQTLPLDDLVVKRYDDIDVNITARQILHMIAEINGCFAHINREGQLKFVYLNDTSCITLAEGGADCYKPSATHENWRTTEIGAVIAYSLNNEQGVTYPSTGGFNALTVSDNFFCYDMSDEELARVAHTMYQALAGITYVAHDTPTTGRPWLEAGDMITLESDGQSITTYIFDRTFTGFQIFQDTLVARAADTRKNDKNSTQQQIERLKRDAEDIRSTYLRADVAEITYATIENLSAANALITQLEAQDAIIRGRLDAAEADITHLQSEKADITDLTAAIARIGVLEGDVATFHQTYTTDITAIRGDIQTLNTTTAQISSLVATKASITDLNAATARIGSLETDVGDIEVLMFGSAHGTSIQTSFANAVIAQLGNAQIKDAMIESIGAGKITAGSIYTNQVRIYGDATGKLSIVDNTISISDGTQVRVQIGKDANDDYNLYVFDENGNLMFDAAGLTANGITRKVVRDDVVQDNANIAASKLNIESLFTVINNDNSHTLNASKVKLNTQNQTLDVAFTSLTNTVNSQGTAISSQGTAISTIQGQISSKIWQQDINTAADSLTQTMNTQYSTLTQNINSVSVELGSEISNLQQQIDGNSSTWTGDDVPTLDNYPAADWAQDGELYKHVGNMYYDANGHSYRFMAEGVYTASGSALIDPDDDYGFTHYWWMLIQDSEVSKALQDAAAALAGVADIEDTLATSYSTTSQMNAAITVAIDGIRSEVSQTYATHVEVTAQAASTLSSANTYADGVGTAAAADATTKANAAEDNAKGYFNTKIADYSTTTDVRSMIQQSADSITQTITNTRTELITYADGIGAAAATDATTKANGARDAAISAAATDATTKADNARDAAISAAATDATTKADNARDAAQGYTDTRLTSYSTTAQTQTMIQQSADSITQTVAATYTTKAEYEQFEVGARNLILNSIDLVGSTHYIYNYGLVDNNYALTSGGAWLVI